MTEQITVPNNKVACILIEGGVSGNWIPNRMATDLLSLSSEEVDRLPKVIPALHQLHQSWTEEGRKSSPDPEISFRSKRFWVSATNINERYQLLWLNESQPRSELGNWKETEEFLSMAVHDLFEPLRSISSFCRLLESKMAAYNDDKTIQYLSQITNAIERMQGLLAGLRSHSDARKAPMMSSELELKEVLGTVRSNLYSAVDESKASIEIAHDLQFKGDRQAIIRIFQNLISNSIKFRASDRPRVMISWEEDADYWRFSVIDNGIGIPNSHFKDIFKPFRRLHTLGTYKGSGMGLAICEKLIEKHGGSIWAVHQKEAGSKICFTLSKDESKESQ